MTAPTKPHSPTPAQVHAVNVAIAELNGIVRLARGDWIKQLPSLLRPDELPEKMLSVDYRGNPECLMVVTNFRVMFMTRRAFSFSKLKVRDFPCYEITDVESSPGMAKHRITIHRGKKKEECLGQMLEGKFRARKMAEHLASKVPGGTDSVAKDARIAKAHALDDLARTLGLRGISTELNQLPDILAEDEIAESLFMAVYDDRKGLHVTAATLEQGLLAVSQDRLIFVQKLPLSKAKVVAFPYGDIERVTFTKGLIFGSVSAWVDGAEEKFDKLISGEVENLARYVEGKLADSPDNPHPFTLADYAMYLSAVVETIAELNDQAHSPGSFLGAIHGHLEHTFQMAQQVTAVIGDDTSPIPKETIEPTFPIWLKSPKVIRSFFLIRCLFLHRWPSRWL